MNKPQAANQAAREFVGKGAAPSQKDIEELVAKLQKIAKPPMSAWKRKLYLGIFVVGWCWILLQYLHYEACREKYPSASGWVCLMQPR